MNENSDNQILYRILTLAFIVVMLLTLIVIRLWKVQVLSGREFDEKSTRQYARNIRIPALRGRIFSADGKLLAGNRPSFEALFHLSEMHLTGVRRESVNRILDEVKRAENTIHKTSGVTPRNIENQLRRYPAIPMAVFTDLDMASLARLAEMTPQIQGLELAARPVRWYPYGSLASGVLGYTGPQDLSTAEDLGDYSYYLPDAAGKSGLEKLYDRQLRGSPGKKLVVVNHRGFVHETVGEPQAAEPAEDLVLTLDTRLQSTAEKLLQGKVGAIVMMDVENGSLLTLASAPGFNLNDFIPRITSRRYTELLNQNGSPFVNKALQGAYMPGSVIKPLIALALLENGVSPDQIIQCDGATRFSDSSRIRCWAWRSGGHGSVDMVRAIKVSCNDYFIENGLKIGVERLAPLLQSAGIGEKTGIGLPESAGLRPDRKRWKRWTVYDTALISIGQGKILVSPVQAVSYTAAFANGGLLWKPRLVQSIYNPVTRTRSVQRPELRGKLNASPAHLSIIREGMFEAVNEPGGGGRNAQVEGLKVYGKTGTAEVGSRSNRTKNTWFIGFAGMPSGRQLACCVLVLNGEAGNKTAAPLAAAMFRKAAELHPAEE